ncbi:MAG: hypothetical protein ACYCX4_04485, partial [Bacillota bacterium]
KLLCHQKSSKADYRLMASLYLTGFSPATCRDLAQSLEPSPCLASTHFCHSSRRSLTCFTL